MIQNYWNTFVELIRVPFQHMELVWGIVPLYVGLALNETTSAKASYRTAIQTGFSFVWAGAHWLYPYFKSRSDGAHTLDFGGMEPVNLAVTLLVILMGVVAFFSGLTKRFPKYCKFLGYTRFANYFMITIFPIQSHYLAWTWDRLAAIAIFAVPIWLVLHFSLMPLRK